MKENKTIAEKLLDQKKIPHNSYTYPADDFMDGVSVAEYINKPMEQVFKTLVSTGNKGVRVFMVPVAQELDLKKAAKASGQKYVEMLPQKDLLATTGYIKGGCSPIGMKKRFPTFIDISADGFETVIFSAGRRGRQIEMGVNELKNLMGITSRDICKEEG